MSKLNLNLTKGAQGLKLSLAKKGVNTPPEAEVAFVMDVSGSFDDEHREGLTQMLLQRLVPWAMVLDPDKQGDVFTFSSGPGSAHHVGTITPANVEGYIASKIISKVPGYNGGTDYSYVLELVLQKFGWLTAPAAPAQQSGGGGFFNRMFGGNKAAPATTPAAPAAKRRLLVLFVTDGDNSDHDRTRRVLRESQQRKDGAYFIFIAVSNQGSTFPFLERIGDEFDNTGFVHVPNLNAFLAASDEYVNEQMIGDELVTWFKQ